ncbi:MAG TPA: ABC transporter permease [Thermoanaerobaculia bacterium]|nr:ABC transporter permease [Thermoanaerobaculia bacterium]
MIEIPASLTRLLAMARKEVLQLRRDTRSLILAFLLPMMLLILFGYAISWDVRNIHIAVLDGDRSAASRELIDAFRSSGYFTIVQNLERPAQIDQLFDRSLAQAVLVIPAGFSSNLSSVQIVVDGSDANTATIVLAYSEAIARTFSGKVMLRGVKIDQPLSSITPESRVWYNEELASRNMIVPGLVAVIMMIIAAMLTSLTIAREWERGTMEQLAATPVSRVEVVLGKLLPYLAIGLADVVVCSILGVLLFDVPFRGSAALLMVLSFFFLTGALGLGIFISAAAKSQVLATQVAMMATYLPAFLLSGFMFAIEVMPAPLRAVTYLVPARYFLVVTRGIFLKGVGIEVLWFQALLMIVFALAGLSLAVLRFRKELE